VISKYKVGDLVFWNMWSAPPDIGLITKIWDHPGLHRPRGPHVKVLWLCSDDGTDVETLRAIETSSNYLTQQEWEDRNNEQT
jgi:hypothetical protein